MCLWAWRAGKICNVLRFFHKRLPKHELHIYYYYYYQRHHQLILFNFFITLFLHSHFFLLHSCRCKLFMFRGILLCIHRVRTSAHSAQYETSSTCYTYVCISQHKYMACSDTDTQSHHYLMRQRQQLVRAREKESGKRKSNK